jgi:hypothetical protein
MTDVNNSTQEEMRILKNIESLQNMEKALYKELEGNSGDPYLKTVGYYPYTVGEGGYTFAGAKEFCAKDGGQLCNKSDIIDKDICVYGWVADGSSGFPMANANAETSWGCGGPTPGWRAGMSSWESNGTSGAGAHCCKTTISPGNAERIVNRINQLSEVRMSLYKSLNYTYQSLQKNVNTSRSELVDLLTVVSVVEDELNNAKVQMNQLYGVKNNKMRMVEINTYYGKRYRAQSGLMKLIIFVSVLLLVLAILRKKSLLPETISNILLGIVIIVGGFFIIWRILDISWRDNMNFDEYNFNFNPDANTNGNNDYSYKVPNIPKIDCIGNACCTDGMLYDETIRKCIRPPNA